MAKAPKNDDLIKSYIAGLVKSKTTMREKIPENIRIKSKVTDYIKNGCGENVAIQSEVITVWTSVFGKQTDDYSQFEKALREAKDKSFNSLDYTITGEGTIDGAYRRIYEIKVN